jgi:hypothetical protein
MGTVKAVPKGGGSQITLADQPIRTGKPSGNHMKFKQLEALVLTGISNVTPPLR